MKCTTTPFFSLLLCLTSFYNYAQTSLSPGDIAIIMGSLDNEEFAFFTRVALDAGTVIYFTDCGADVDGLKSPTCGEGGIKYMAPAGGVSAGTIVIYNGLDFPTITFYNSDSRIVNGFLLDNDGDQIIAFQDNDPGDMLDPGQDPKFLFALNLASTIFTGNKNSEKQTGLPAGLSTSGTITALGVGKSSMPSDDWNNVVYNGTYDHGSVDAAYAAFTDVNNWLRTDNNVMGGPFETAVNNIPTAIILPIELLSFQAKPYDDHITLNWQTALELNNAYMAIERSADGRSFAEIGRIAGAGTVYEMREYTFADEQPLIGTNYYRLRQVDFDNTSTYHKVIAVPYGGLREEAILYPSLASDLVSLTLAKPLTTDAWLQIQNINGQIVSRQLLQADEQQWDISIHSFDSGQYVVQLQLSDETIIRRFFKVY